METIFKPLSAQFINECKTKLLEKKQNIINKLKENQEDYQYKEEVPKDIIDLATEGFENSLLEQLEASDINELRLIENALIRIVNNRYGLCVSCNKMISKARLEALPEAILCIDCKRKQEQKRR